MADEDDGGGEDDGIEDTGAPPVIPGMRVWVNPTGREALTDDERDRLGILDIPVIPSRGVDNFTAASADTQQNRGGASAEIIVALVKKFPDFDPKWPAKTQAAWFASFEQLMRAGLK